MVTLLIAASRAVDRAVRSVDVVAPLSVNARMLSLA